MRLAAGLLACAVLAAGAPPAQAAQASSAEYARQQAEAERRREALRERIGTLQKQIEARESDRREAADALRESESEISRITRTLDELAAGIEQARADIERLQSEIAEQQKVMSARRDDLAAQLRTQYASGLSPWTALLSGDDPQQLGRNLAYLGYVSRARAAEVEALRREIDRLQALQQRERERRADLQALQEKTAAARQELVEQQKERATVLARLEGQLQAQRSEAGRLDRDADRLGGLIEDLAGQVAAARAEERRRAEEERRRIEEERRRAELARRQAEAARQQAEAARLKARQAEQAQAEAARRVDAERQEAARQQAEAARREAERQAREAVQAQQRAEEEAQAGRPVARGSLPGAVLADAGGLQGPLARPVRGAVMARFGTDRPDGGKWRGMLIQAAEGTTVEAVGAGTVVYADWLRGFGNLIIVDHGRQFLSVYAYNQGLLKRVGDSVATGEAIATVGSTGGQVESGLYFEIRHRGAPQDPAKFLAR